MFLTCRNGIRALRLQRRIARMGMCLRGAVSIFRPQSAVAALTRVSGAASILSDVDVDESLASSRKQCVLAIQS